MEGKGDNIAAQDVSKEQEDVSARDSAWSEPAESQLEGGTVADGAGEEGSISSSLERLAIVERITSRLSDLGLAKDPKEREPILESFDLEGVAKYIKEGKARRIICMCGAGISVSAGIPDFRSPGTGLYDNLQKYDLPNPQAVFEIQFFRKNPKPFYALAKELFPGRFYPTATHYFMKLLHDKKLLSRVWTQNIDSLETAAGIPGELVVPAHGNFDSSHCTSCGKEYDKDYVWKKLKESDECKCEECVLGFVKPDIVFFGEPLPDRFWSLRESDFDGCDLLIVMGTSLVVYPFAGLIHAPKDDCPRVLINREVVGEASFGSKGFDFEDSNHRDAKFLGDCDDGVMALAKILGWEKELAKLISTSNQQLKEKMDKDGIPPYHSHI